MKKILLILFVVFVSALTAQVIEDENFKKGINIILEQSSDYEPTIEDLSKVTDQVCLWEYNIDSIEGAQYLSKITRLFLGENND